MNCTSIKIQQWFMWQGFCCCSLVESQNNRVILKCWVLNSTKWYVLYGLSGIIIQLYSTKRWFGDAKEPCTKPSHSPLFLEGASWFLGLWEFCLIFVVVLADLPIPFACIYQQIQLSAGKSTPWKIEKCWTSIFFVTFQLGDVYCVFGFLGCLAINFPGVYQAL